MSALCAFNFLTVDPKYVSFVLGGSHYLSCRNGLVIYVKSLSRAPISPWSEASYLFENNVFVKCSSHDRNSSDFSKGRGNGNRFSTTD